ncbi:hypothetical protein [Paenarthrobacter nitroguajacolicus]|uniref:hypothetical protein n=1 Tax=Paenarthrobacter nitroguajacolicus TaxID=211146 RepID=UPI001FCC80FD|nr:hypothetical protein [Paenarthrobacter nitroguajacolicus]
MTRRRNAQTRQRAVKLSVLTLALVSIAWLGSVLWAAIDEGAVPPDAAFHAVPPPSQAGPISTGCGSGGCWREMVVDIKPPHTAQSLAAEMGLASERCEPMNLWTLRKTCTGIADSGGRGLHIYLQYSLLLSKY